MPPFPLSGMKSDCIRAQRPEREGEHGAPRGSGGGIWLNPPPHPRVCLAPFLSLESAEREVEPKNPQHGPREQPPLEGGRSGLKEGDVGFRARSRSCNTVFFFFFFEKRGNVWVLTGLPVQGRLPIRRNPVHLTTRIEVVSLFLAFPSREELSLLSARGML